MNQHVAPWSVCAIIALVVLAMNAVVHATDVDDEGSVTQGSFERFDELARAGRRMNVAFIGGSLTWGANSTDPQRTSYRARVGQWLADRYPKSQIICHDASIGGTGSRLGIFRLERDVLAKKPDLLILDFTANDNIRHSDADALASYEAIVRRTIVEAKCPVVLVILPFKADLAASAANLKRWPMHIAVAKAYGCAVGDAVELLRSRFAEKKVTLDAIWDNPKDSSHPGDAGYGYFAEAVTSGFEKAVADKLVSHAPPAMLNPDTYMTTCRAPLVKRSLPEGWSSGVPNRIGAYFDMQPSRWLDSLVVAEPNAKPLTIKFRGTFIGVFGEGLPVGGAFNATIDGKRSDKPFETSVLAAKAGGAVRYFVAIGTDLAPDVDHILVIEPALANDQTLRFESITLAGTNCRLTD